MRKWSRELIIQEVLKLSAEGQSLKSSDIKDSNQALYRAATRYFTSWAGLLHHLKINPYELSFQEFEKKIQNYIKNKKKVTQGLLIERNLHQYYNQYFNSWYSFLKHFNLVNYVNDDELCRVLRDIRADLTQRELGEKVNLSREMISKLESGERRFTKNHLICYENIGDTDQIKKLRVVLSRKKDDI